MTIKLLSSGYWHVRFSANQFIQWPSWADLSWDHGFGWLTGKHYRAAKDAAKTYQRLGLTSETSDRGVVYRPDRTTTEQK